MKKDTGIKVQKRLIFFLSLGLVSLMSAVTNDSSYPVFSRTSEASIPKTETIECPICTNILVESEEIVSPESILPCGHHKKFHSGCLQEWFKKQKNCPLCRCGEVYEEPLDESEDSEGDDDSLVVDEDDAQVSQFFYYLEQGNYEALAEILEEEGDFLVNCYYRETGYTPLMAAVDTGCVEKLNFLIDRGADVAFANSNGISALTQAIKKGHAHLIPLLLERGATINPDAQEEIIPLVQAIQESNQDIVSLLLHHHADINVYDDYGENKILDAALDVGKTDIIALLFEHNAQMYRDKPGINQILLAAAHKGHAHVIAFLIGQGADKDTADSSGNTPLIIAAQAGKVSIVKELLRQGVALNTANKRGFTAREAARHQGRKKTLLILDKALNADAAQALHTKMNQKRVMDALEYLGVCKRSKE